MPEINGTRLTVSEVQLKRLDNANAELNARLKDGAAKHSRQTFAASIDTGKEAPADSKVEAALAKIEKELEEVKAKEAAAAEKKASK